MKNQKSIDIKLWLSMLGAPIIVGVILLIIYAIKGIYPFGSGNISYFDMAQSFVPTYYHTYDVLHGTKNIFWDWYSGGGVSMVDTAGNFILSPFNLFFFFVKREMILESMSFFLLLKVCVCAGTASFYFRKTYRNTDWYWHVLAGVIYASGGFVIQYYSNIHFLDMVALFPIIIYFTDRLLQKKKVVGYSIIMASGFVISIYFMVMICIYLILYSMGQIRKLDKTERKSRAVLLGIGTLVGGCISATISIPTIIALLQSSRSEVGEIMSSGYKYYTIINSYYENKMFMLYGCEFVIALLLLFVLFRRSDLKKISHTIRMLVLMILPIFFELVNQFWHIGGYVEFPMRFGYMLTFTGIMLMGEILQVEKEQVKDKKVVKGANYLQLLAIAGVPLILVMLYFFTSSFLLYGIRDAGPYNAYWPLFWTMICIFAFAMLGQNIKTTVITCSLIIFMQSGLGWYGFLAPEDMYSIECTDSIVKNTERIRTAIDMDEGEGTKESIGRVKDASMSLNSNYPFILEKPSMSNWTLGTKPGLRNQMWRLGYSSAYTRIVDNGGTLFSDALLDIDSMISWTEPEKELFEVKEVEEGYYFSEYKYDYPFGLVVSDNMIDWTGSSDVYALEYQNEVFKAINNCEQELIAVYDIWDVLTKEEYLEELEIYRYYFEIPTDEAGNLYWQVADINNYYNVYINDELLLIPNQENPENSYYPLPFTNGILNCGYHNGGEKVECRVECFAPIETGGVFGDLRLSVLQESIDVQKEYERMVTVGKNSVTMEVQASDGQYLLVPIGFDEKCKVKVNGVKEDALPTLEDAFFLIPLEAGVNKIEINFQPQGLWMSVVISVIGIVVLLLFIRYNKEIVRKKIMQTGMYFLLLVCEIGLLTIIYVLPILYTIYMQIQYKSYIG